MREMFFKRTIGEISEGIIGVIFGEISDIFQENSEEVEILGEISAERHTKNQALYEQLCYGILEEKNIWKDLTFI